MFNSILIALKSLLGNKARSVLTLLGIIFGVASVVIVLSTSEAIEVETEKAFAGIGTNLIFAWGGWDPVTRRAERYTLEDIELLKARCPSAVAFSPTINERLPVVFGRDSEDLAIKGAMPELFVVQKFPMKEGSSITQSDVDQKRKLAIIGSRLEEQYFKGRSAVGSIIRIGNTSFTIKGILQEKGGWQREWDSSVIIPFSTSMELFGQKEFWEFQASATSMETTELLAEEIRLVLSRERDYTAAETEKFIHIENAGEWLKESREFNKTIQIFLSVIGGISLFIGGIGIMNIMLVTVTERIREIGVRKAVGATEIDIMMQFLIEAVTLCMIGGAIGIGLGQLANIQLAKLPDFLSLSVSVKTTTIALSVSMGIGVLFGFWPAARAARMNPIEALRHE